MWNSLIFFLKANWEGVIRNLDLGDLNCNFYLHHLGEKKLKKLGMLVLNSESSAARSAKADH